MSSGEDRIPRILLVEDEAVIGLSEQASLEKQGYEVVLVLSGTAALAAVESSPFFDLILMDIDLGAGMDGTETAERILALQDLPLAFLTNHAEQEFVEAAERVTSYGYILKSSGEFVLLQVVRSILQRRAAEDLLNRREREYRLLVENQSDLVVKVDRAGRFEFVSESYCRLFGTSREELIGRSFVPLVHEEDRERTRRAMEELYEPPYECRIEQRAMTRHGWRWLEWEDRAVLDSEGAVASIIGSGRDITERKEAEREVEEGRKRLEESVREKDRLLKELNHRVKNNLALVSSLVRLKEAELPDQTSLQDIRHHIDAISFLHGKLYESDNVSSINIASYVASLMPSVFSFCSLGPVTVHSQVEALEIPTKVAVVLGVILNELGTNAMKYGFRKGEEAVFSIALHPEAPPDGEKGAEDADGVSGAEGACYLLEVENSGNPFPEETCLENSGSLGLRLVLSLVRQLGGELSLRRSPSARFVIRVPAEKLNS